MTFYAPSPCSMLQHVMWQARTALWWRHESAWADAANVDTKSRTVAKISWPTFVDLVVIAEMMAVTSKAFGSTLMTSWLSSMTSGTQSSVMTGGLMAVKTMMMMTRIGGNLMTMVSIMITGGLLETTMKTAGGHLVTTMTVMIGGPPEVMTTIPGGISRAMVAATLLVDLNTLVPVTVQLENQIVAVPRTSQWPPNLEHIDHIHLAAYYTCVHMRIFIMRLVCI